MKVTPETGPASGVLSSPRSEFVAGLRGALPLWLGIVPIGFIYGPLTRSAALDPVAAQAMSLIISAGSAQFILAPLLTDGTPLLLAVLVVFVVNVRHALYSATLTPFLRSVGTRWKWLLAYLLSDETFAVVIGRYRREDGSPHKHWYFLGSGLSLWVCWNASTAAGIFAGAQIPAGWPLDFALPLTFIAVVVPVLRDRASLAAALCAGVCGVLAFALPYRLGLLVAAMAGIAAGMLIEARRS